MIYRPYNKMIDIRRSAFMETIDMLIYEIESEVLKAKKAAFSNSDIVINKAVLLDLISRFRASYPLVLREATQIKKERDDIIEKAEKYANETMDKAEEQAKRLMAETEVYARAKAEAEAMQREAEENYHKMDYEARSLAFNILDGAEKTIKDSLGIINDRKRKLVEE